MNLAKLLEGPAVVTHRGQKFHSRGGKQLDATASAFGIESDAHGTIGQRALDNAIALSLTPIGVWDDDQLDVLFRWQNPRPGQLLTPRYDIDSIDIASEIITLLGAQGPRIGGPFRVATWGTIPTGLAAATLYYAGVPNLAEPWKITPHLTEADALAGVNKVNITDAQAASEHAIIEQEPLTIHTFDNRKIVFHNAAILQMPSIIHSAVASMLGPCSFAAFRKNDAAWLDANSLYTITKELLTDVPPDEDDIPTQEYSGAWGAAPFDAFKFRGALTITPRIATAPVTTDRRGELGLKITNIGVQATGAPEGLTEAQMLDVLGMQGGAVARGKSKVRADLVVTGTGVHNIVYNAAPTALPQTFSVDGPRAGELAFVGARPPGSAAFYVGTAAP